MDTEEIKKKFHKERILDKALSAARKNAGGDNALIRSGVQNVIDATTEEIYLLGWRDAEAQINPRRETESRIDSHSYMPYTVDRDRPTKPLKVGEIDREAIENAKDMGKLDISVLGLSRRVYIRLQERGIKTIGELAKAIDAGLTRVRGIGDAAYKEIIAQVEKAELLAIET